MRSGLTPEEDAELRRLHFFNRLGAVTGRFRQRYAELRARDRRTSIREPDESQTVVVVNQKAS